MTNSNKPRFISCYKLEPCQNEDCDIRTTGIWKMPDGKRICDNCKKKAESDNSN